jgi:cysteine desulfurase
LHRRQTTSARDSKAAPGHGVLTLRHGPAELTRLLLRLPTCVAKSRTTPRGIEMEDLNEGVVTRPIYADYNATTPVDPRVAQAMLPYLTGGLKGHFGNPSSSHTFGRTAKAAVTAARAQVAAAIGASSADEIVFCGCSTESINSVFKGVCDAAAARGTSPIHVVTTAVEHVAVLEVAAWLAAARGVQVTYVAVGEDGRVRPEDVVAAVRPNTALVSVMHANNETGALQPVAAIAAALRLAHPGHGVLLHTDASQSVGKVAFDVRALGVHLATLAGHKLYAPKGVAATWMASIARSTLVPLLHGARGQEAGLRAGTENVAYIVALGTACALAAAEVPTAAPRMAKLRERLLARLTAALPDAVVHGPLRTARVPEGVGSREPAMEATLKAAAEAEAGVLPNTLSIAFPGAVAGHVVEALANTVACSAGAACHSADVAQATSQHVSHVLEAMRVPRALAVCTLRLSLGRWSTEAEVDAAADHVVAAVRAARIAAAAAAAARVASAGAVPVQVPAALVEAAVHGPASPLPAVASCRWFTDRAYIADPSAVTLRGADVLAVAVRTGNVWRTVLPDGTLADEATAQPPAAAWGGLPTGVPGLQAAVMLRATVAHPQGGGQPADTGALAVDQGVAGADGQLRPVFAFTTTRRGGPGADEAVVHMGYLLAPVGVEGGAGGGGSGCVDESALRALADGITDQAPPTLTKATSGAYVAFAVEPEPDTAALATAVARAFLAAGAPVKVMVAINWPRRALAARLHSGGHLLDLAVKRALAGTQYAAALAPGKGYHFADSPYVEYSVVPGAGPLPAELVAGLPAALTAACAALAAADAPTDSALLPAGSHELAAALAPSGASVAHLIPGAPVRIVAVGGADNACPCGGTHVRSAGQLVGLVVTAARLKKGLLRVSYSVPVPEAGGR